MNRGLAIATLSVAILGLVGYAAFRGFQAIRPASMTVENQTDRTVTISVSTVYRLDVPPHTTSVLRTGWFPYPHDVFEVTTGAPYKHCAWQKHLIVDDVGAQCDAMP